MQYWRANEKLATFREVEVPISTLLIPTVNNRRKKRAPVEATFNVTNLTPFSNMQIQICVMNNYYVGPPSDVVSFNTLEGGKSFKFWVMLCLTLFQTTNFGLFQTERVLQMRIFIFLWKRLKVLWGDRKQCGKVRNCLLQAISLIPTVFS